MKGMRRKVLVTLFKSSNKFVTWHIQKIELCCGSCSLRYNPIFISFFATPKSGLQNYINPQPEDLFSNL